MTAPLHHNVVSILYSIKSLAETHLCKKEEGFFQDPVESVEHSENVLKRMHSQADRAIGIMRFIQLTWKDVNSMSKRSKVSVRAAWRRSLKRVSEDYDLDDIEIIERIPQEFPALCCNRDEFCTIFYQLASNAVRAMKENQISRLHGQRLVIRVQLAYDEQEKAHAVIALSDSGPGMTDTQLAKLFKPFFTTKPDDHTGIGLYITRELVHKNRGKVSVSSFLEHGTTFTLQFPIAASARTPAVV